MEEQFIIPFSSHSQIVLQSNTTNRPGIGCGCAHGLLANARHEINVVLIQDICRYLEEHEHTQLIL